MDQPLYRNYIEYKFFQFNQEESLNKEEAMEEADFLSFLLKPESLESKLLIRHLIQSCFMETGKRKQGEAEFKNAMELTIPMLLKAAGKDESGYVYRSVATASFKADLPYNVTATGLPVGYRAFRRVIDARAREGFLEIITGFKECTASVFSKGVATRFKATDKLIALARYNKVFPEFWFLHFKSAPRPVNVADPVILKTGSTTTWKQGQNGKKGKQEKQRGIALPVDYSLSNVAAYAERVNRLNGYMAHKDIQPAHLHHYFVRVFGEGDGEGADYSKGGRIYSRAIGKGYQNVKKRIRREMTISGEAIAEVDLRASYLTILHERMGYPLPTTDPYDMPDVPRGIAKMWISATLGNGGLLTRWPDELKEKYRKNSADKNGDLQADHPIGETGRKIMRNLPIMREWLKNPIGWGELQSIESAVIMDAISTLAFEYDIPALPLHDALIVAESKANIAGKCLWESFYKIVGIYPYMSISTHDRATMKLAA